VAALFTAPFEGLSKSATLTGGALRSSGYYLCAPVRIQLGLTGF